MLKWCNSLATLRRENVDAGHVFTLGREASAAAPQSICFLSASPGVWGAEESLMSVARGLQEDGWLVSAVCLSQILAKRWRQVVNMSVVVLPCRHPGKWRLYDASLLWCGGMVSGARHLVAFTYYLAVLLPCVKPLATLWQRTLVVDLHDNLSGARGLALFRKVVSHAHAVVCVSEYTRDQVMGLNVRSSVIYRPIDPFPAFAPTSAQSRAEPPRVGVVGRLVPEKNHNLVIEAIARVPPCVLVLRGEATPGNGEYGARIISEAQRLLGDRFIYDGKSDQPSALLNLDVLVVGNAREPMGRTVAEAQLGGVVAVVPRTGGSSELVRDGQTGYVYNPDDRDSLAQVLKHCMSVRDDEGTLLNAARSAAEARHSLRSYVDAFETLMGRAAR